VTDDDFLKNYKRRTLKDHVCVGEQKPISYQLCFDEVIFGVMKA
jgi:hypothetical protein